MRTAYTVPVMIACGLLVGLASPPQPVLSVSPTTVTVSGTAGAPVPSASVSIRNAGNGALKWTVAVPGATWATVTPMSGTNSGTLSVSFPSTFAAGNYSTAFVITSSASYQTVTVNVSIAAAPDPTPQPPASSSGYGPQPTIVCQAGAVTVAPGVSIQAAVNADPSGTTFCLLAGVHYLTSAITPKTGDTFIGEYGAVLDGSGWSTTDTNQGAFRTHNQDIDNVTIQNLVIRRMPQRGIHAFYAGSSGWVIDHVEIAECRTGIEAGAASVVRDSVIHDNVDGGYSAYRAAGTTFEHNEIAHNGSEQKIVQSQGVTFRNNDVHDNASDGIWFDYDNTGAIIDGNLVQHNGRHGIDYEISGQALIRGNTVSDNGDNGIFVSISHDVDIGANALAGNFRGIQYFLDCGRLDGEHDMARVSAHDNVVAVPATSGAFGNGFSYLSTTCTSAQLAPYLGGQKALTFSGNRYTVPSLAGRWWIWGFGHLVDWPTWQALPQDATGSATE